MISSRFDDELLSVGIGVVGFGWSVLVLAADGPGDEADVFVGVFGAGRGGAMKAFVGVDAQELEFG